METSKINGKVDRSKIKTNSQRNVFGRDKGVSKKDKDIKFGWVKIDRIEKRSFKGILYDLITEKGNYIGNDIVVHNCDAVVHDDFEINNGSISTIQNLKVHGGGGTDMGKILEYCKEKIPNNRLLIILTDGYTPWPENKYPFETIWVISKEGVQEKEVPWGRVIKLT